MGRLWDKKLLISDLKERKEGKEDLSGGKNQCLTTHLFLYSFNTDLSNIY